MNATKLTHVILLLPSIFLGCVQLAEAARTSVLRYRLPEGQTNLYSVQVEVRGETGTETLAGNLFVTTKTGASNVLCLGFRGLLVPKRDAGPMRPPMFGGGSGYPRWMSPISLNDAEIQFDDRGRVLRAAGDYPLPIPLGTLAQLFVEPLSAKAEARWEITEELAVLDEPLALGPAVLFLPAQPYGMPYYSGPYNPSRNAIAGVAVTRKLRYESKSTASDTVTLAKRLSLDSGLLVGAEPRISASGEGEVVLDRESGLLRRAELSCKAVSNTETVTRRTTTTLRVKLLEGAEREAAWHPPPQTATRPMQAKLNGAEIQKLMEDLKCTDAGARLTAASKLQTSELLEAPPALLELMVGFLTDEDASLRAAAVKILADYGTAEHVPALLKLLKDGDSSSRYAAIRGLGRLKDKRAAEPLAALLASGGSDAHQAVEALTKIGPDVEDAVLPLLKERHNDTKRQACNVLKAIGTKKSLALLRDLMLNTDRMLSEAAAEAVRAILTRE